MATTVIDGLTIHYEVHGDSGPPVFLTPGGRQGREAFRRLARTLADACQVVIWDRPNTGASDVYLDGELAEQERWANDLAGLVRELGMAPAYLGGGSAGCRIALMTAVRYPELVRGLVLFMATGGPYAAQNLGYQYHVPYIQAAQQGGMDAVAKTPHFAERIAANPSNLDRILKLDPKEFVRTMRRWNETFYYQPGSPVIAVTEEQLRSLRVPVLLCEGNDDHHPKVVSDRLASLLPDVTVVPTPWTHEEWIEVAAGHTGTTPARELLPRLAAPFRDFIVATEARLAQPAR